MPRPPLVIGAWGKITRTKRDGVNVAKARYRDHDGVTRLMERTGRTAQIAENNLIEAMRDRLRLDGDDITQDSTISATAERWFADQIEGRRALNTERRYREIIDGVVVPGLGSVRLRELSVSRLDRFLKLTGHNRGAATARVTRTVLSGIVGMATRFGAVPSNMLRDVDIVKATAKEVVVLPLEQLWDLRAKMRADDLAVNRDLPDPVDFMLATGARIGEALAMRWPDIDLNNERPTATIRATVVWVNGRGETIQERPKSASSIRVVTLPGWAADMLRERKGRYPNDLDLVFPSMWRTVRSPSNLRRQWRELRAAIGYDWVVPHTFRKSVATLAGDDELAAQQLGHASSAVTKKHYVPKTHVAPDLREQLDQIGADPTFTQRNQREPRGYDGNNEARSSA